MTTNPTNPRLSGVRDGLLVVRHGLAVSLRWAAWLVCALGGLVLAGQLAWSDVQRLVAGAVIAGVTVTFALALWTRGRRLGLAAVLAWAVVATAVLALLAWWGQMSWPQFRVLAVLTAGFGVAGEVVMRAGAGSRARQKGAPDAVLTVKLSPARQEVLASAKSSLQEMQHHLPMLRSQSVKAAVDHVVSQQRDLFPDLERTLHLAQWLERRIESRGPGSASPDLLARISERIKRLDAEAQQVAQRLANAELSLVATIGEHDERHTVALFHELADTIESYYTIVRDVSEEIRRFEQSQGDTSAKPPSATE